MLPKVSLYAATATFAGRSGRRKKNKQPVLSPLRIELLGQRLDSRPQIHSARRCIDRAACAREKNQDQTCRKPEYTPHSYLLWLRLGRLRTTRRDLTGCV